MCIHVELRDFILKTCIFTPSINLDKVEIQGGFRSR